MVFGCLGQAAGDEGALDGIEIWIEWETQEVTIIDAWIKSGTWVDNDGDGYASALSLEWDANVSYGTMSVYANLRADDWLSGERDLGNTGNYTLGTSATRKDFAVPVDSKNLNHKTWDFQIDLYKAGTTTRVARLSMGADPQLNDVKVELSSEDIAPPEIDVQGNGLSIPDGYTTPRTDDGTDFGSVDKDSGSVTHPFIIRNTGTGTLNIPLPIVKTKNRSI
jgi:hypothetical protein